MSSATPWDDLARRFPGALHREAAWQITHGYDATHSLGRPDAVLWLDNPDRVPDLLTWAKVHRVPVIARGSGTGLAGNAVPARGGVVLVLSGLNRVLHVEPVGRYAWVEPGVINLELDQAVARYGLHYPPDPASQRVCTVGGNVATNAGGPHCFKYGVTASYVLGLEGWTVSGARLRLGGPAYDGPDMPLLDLFIGSEGTLAVFTRLWVRLLPRPLAARTLMAAFSSLEDAGRAVSAVVAAGLVPAAMELMDRKMLRIVEDFVHLGLPVEAAALLLVEVDGYPEALDPQVEEIARLLEAHGAWNLRIARTETERQELWKARKSAAGAFARLAPAYYLADFSVPRSAMARTFARLDAIAQKYGLTVAYLGHAGDGNLHALIAISDPEDNAALEPIRRAAREMLRVALDEEGTIAGEHGVGLDKRDTLAWMYGPAELRTMLEVKAALDPDGLLNPGKVFPDDLNLDAVTVRTPYPEAFPGEPPAVFAPSTAEEAAAWLRAMKNAGKRIGVAAQPRDPGPWAWLSAENLRGVLRIATEDLFIEVAAGTPLQDVHAALAETPFFLPMAAPRPETPVAALMARNLLPPSRTRYGAWRDLLLAAEAVLPDGRIVRFGRPVVKDVAGYAVGKLFIGTGGAFGLVTKVTLKLVPRPRARATLVWRLAAPEDAFPYALEALRHLRLASAWLLVADGPATTLLYTGEGWPEEVAAEIRMLTERLRDLGKPEPAAEDGLQRWAVFLSRPDPVVRVGVPPERLPELLARGKARSVGPWLADVLHGWLYVPLETQAPRQALMAWRSLAATLEGFVFPLRVPETAADAAAACWPEAARNLYERLRDFWDPDRRFLAPWEPEFWHAHAGPV